MKIKGVQISGPHSVIIPIVREGGDIIIKAQAVLDYEEFDKLCPPPTPPMMRRTGESQDVPDLNDRAYKEKLNEFAVARSNYLVIKSLEATEGLEWETVNVVDPSTWGNYLSEFRKSGFSDSEVGRIISGVFEANGLDESKIREAKTRFLASRLQKV